MLADRTLRFLVEPALDVPRQWVGHCLELDILSAGTSLDHALAMTKEAVTLCLADDAERGLPETARKPAPPEYFARWEALRESRAEGALMVELPRAQ